MKRNFLIGSITLVALGASGLAIAEGGNTPHDPQQKQPTAEQQPMQEESELQQGQQSAEAQQQEPQRVGVKRLDSVKLSVIEEEQAKNLQQQLSDLGYYKAEIDGKIGPKTKAALQQYFRDQATLVAQGRLSEVGMTSLGFDESEIQRVRGLEEQGDVERTPMGEIDEPTQDQPENVPQQNQPQPMDPEAGGL